MNLNARKRGPLAFCRAVLAITIFLSAIFASPVVCALDLDLFNDDSSSQTVTSIRNKLGRLEEISDRANTIENQVLAFYRARDYRPAWSGSERAERQAKLVRDTLQRSYEQGLRPSDYRLPAINADSAPSRGDAAATYDLAMTTAVLQYAHDVHLGRFEPTQVYKDIDLPPRHFDAAASLNAAVRHDSLDEFFANLPPAHPEYRNLVAALARYRAMAARGETAQGDGSAKPIGFRMQQIAANMERWRWMPAALENRYIRVDVPDQVVEYVRDGEVVLQSRVVIGRPDAHTPILRTEVQSVIANPPWYIPDDIAIRTILPHLRNTHGYLAAHDISFEQGQFKQAPGPHNGLGVLMLDAPNPFWVYMHDTPSKSLFHLDVREKSNGCVRVEKIFQLASLALTDDESAGADTLNDAISTGQTQQLELPHSLPAYMLYWTARADENGNVDFHPDRYNRDPPLIAKLGFGAAPSSMRLASVKKPKTHLKVQPTSLDVTSSGAEDRVR